MNIVIMHDIYIYEYSAPDLQGSYCRPVDQPLGNLVTFYTLIRI